MNGNNNEIHVHVIKQNLEKKTRIEILSSLTRFMGFHNYGVVMGVHSFLEPGTTCVHDLEIKTPNIQDFLPIENDICTICSLEIPSSTYTSDNEINHIDPNHM